VGVHIRQTDFATAAGGRYYFSPAEYRQVCERIREAEKDARFLIVTDGDVRCIEEEFKQIEGVVYRGGDLYHDLAFLAECDYIFGSVASTFSRWAAFWRDKPWLGLDREGVMNLDGAVSFSTFEKGMMPWKGQ